MRERFTCGKCGAPMGVIACDDDPSLPVIMHGMEFLCFGCYYEDIEERLQIVEKTIERIESERAEPF